MCAMRSVRTQPELFGHGAHDTGDEARVLHGQGDAHRVCFGAPVRAQRLAKSPFVEAAPGASLMLPPGRAMAAATQDRVDQAVERILRAHASFWTRSNMF